VKIVSHITAETAHLVSFSHLMLLCYYDDNIMFIRIYALGSGTVLQKSCSVSVGF